MSNYNFPALIVVFVPLLAFGVAIGTELLAPKPIRHLFGRLCAPLLGIAALGLLLDPGVIGVVTPEASEVISHLLVMVGAAISCSGVVVTYSRRSSGIWVALDGLTLVFIAMFVRD